MNGKVAIDTNAYSALDKGNKVVIDAINQASILGLPIIVLGELYFGFEKGTKRQINMAGLSKWLRLDNLEILHITHATARIFGEISAELATIGRPIQQNDVWIAALCKQYGYTLVSADTGFGYIKGLDSISF